MRAIVVGGGILGASVAFHLVRTGAAVTIVDAAHAGRATAAGAGIICPWASGVEDGAFYALYAAGARYYPAIVAELAEVGAGDTGYSRVGALCVAEDPRALAMIEALAGHRASEAPEAGEVRCLGPEAARSMFPPLAKGLGAVLVSGGARVDGRRMTAALIGAAHHLGLAEREGGAALIAEAGRVKGVRVGGETLAADLVVVTAGAWAPQLLRPLGIALPIVPERGQLVHFELADGDTGRWPVVLPMSTHYLLAFEAGRIVAGATREDAGFDHRVTAAGLAEVLGEALSVAPALARASVIETRVGFRPVAPDHRPILGWAPGVAGLLIGNGLGAAGLTIGPYAGRVLARIALGQDPEIDASAFRVDRRFAEGEPGATILR